MADPAMHSPAEVRGMWCVHAQRLAAPLLHALAQRRLRATMPVEGPKAAEQQRYTHLEGFARLLCGLAPWLTRNDDDDRWAALAREAIDAITDPASPDCGNFTEGNRQPLVDTAFLAQALLRAPQVLWAPLPERVRTNVIDALVATRRIEPWENNWVLFAAIIEAALHRFGVPYDGARLGHGLKRHRDWYLGDGWYGDGPQFHADYYNSYVIHPMLVEVLDAVAEESAEWREMHAVAVTRLARFAAIQERMIAPDGSYPLLGRSIAYRGGAFQALALAAWRHGLPGDLPPAQVRRALTSVLQRTLGAPDTFDPNGWLRIGLAGSQPSLAEEYISTGSLYLCSTLLLPLGLPADDPFWSAPDMPTTWERAWAGVDLPADHAL